MTQTKLKESRIKVPYLHYTKKLGIFNIINFSV